MKHATLTHRGSRATALAVVLAIASDLAFAVAVAGAVSACQKTAPKPPPPPEVQVATVTTPENIPLYYEFVATLDGDVNAEIRARVKGFLTTQDYKEGGYVKAGQTLFTIDPSQFKASALEATGDLGMAKASLMKAEADVARLTPLYAKNAVAKQDLDNALAEREAAKGRVMGAQGQLRNADINLGYTKVVSPIDGIAGMAKVRVGNLVGQDGPTLLTTVSSVNPIRATFAISEQLYMANAEAIRKLNETREERLQLVLSDGSTYPYRGWIALADRQVDIATGTFTLQAFFPNPGNVLRPGQYGRVRGARKLPEGAVLVPQRAVSELQGIFQVAVVAPDDVVTFRKVKATNRIGSFWVIEDGLKPGERIVVEGLQKVRTGKKVEVAPYTLDFASITADAGTIPTR